MTRYAPFALLAALTLGLAAPAAAACRDDVAALEERLAQVKEGPAEDQPVEVETDSGEVTVEAEADSEEPRDSWFGPVPSRELAREQLDNARQLAEDGDEAGCGQHREQAREVIEGLEG